MMSPLAGKNPISLGFLENQLFKFRTRFFFGLNATTGSTCSPAFMYQTGKLAQMSSRMVDANGQTEVVNNISTVKSQCTTHRSECMAGCT